MMHFQNFIPTTPVLGSDGWHTAIVEITPEMADKMLKKNSINRRLRPGAVARYAAAMRKGDWQTSPEALMFTSNGTLLNGQNRLNAVKATGVAQKFMCVFGVSEAVYAVLDRGSPRNMADALRLDKETAEMARVLTHIVAPLPFAGSAVADKDLLQVVQIAGDIHADLRAFCGTKSRYFGSAAFRAAAVARILDGGDPVFVMGMYDALNRGHTERLPRSGASAVQHVLTGKWTITGGGQGQREALARAWHTFDERQSDKPLPRKIDVGTTVEQVKTAVAAALKSAFGDSADD